jgi:predicted RNA-binding Zn ribbon-like protein
VYSPYMSISPTLADMQRNGFPVGGEPFIALDLVDTVANAHTAPVDLLESHAGVWWDLESGRLPRSPTPADAAVRRLRSTLRELFEASIDGRVVDAKNVAELNRVAGSAVSIPVLELVDGVPRAVDRWQTTRDGNPRLAAIAREAIGLLADPERGEQLRRCANPTCSMLFMAENPRRVWCASNICGNRARVARHQHRQSQTT